MRDIAGLLLLVTAGVEGILAYYLIRSERIKHGSWRNLPVGRGIRLAGTFFSHSLLLGVLGVLILGGDSGFPWWATVIVVNAAIWPVLLWIDWARAPTERRLPSARPTGKGYPDDA